MKNDRKDRIWIKCMELGAKLGCHQKPERSFAYKGYQFPVCARCSGIIISTILAYIICYKRKISLWINVVMIASMVIDGSIQYIGIQESNNLRRFITGCMGGFGLNAIRMRIYIFLLEKLKNTKERKTKWKNIMKQ